MKWCRFDWGSWGVPRPGAVCALLRVPGAALQRGKAAAHPKPSPPGGCTSRGSPLPAPARKAPREVEAARCSLHGLLLQRGCWGVALTAQDFPAGPPRTGRCCHVSLIEYLKNTWKANKINSNQACSAKQQIHSPVLLLAPLLTKFSSWPGCCLFYFSMFKAFKVPRRPRG